ncbi:hypothetical protein [Nocardia aurea]|uniref:DUF3592 domain-containing protein n=1 Tax=Nocardia aurea TaxID=2144174 RepID=A0ABV3FKR0_9NOCA
MALRQLTEQFDRDGGTRVFGEPYETEDGTTIVTVSRIRAKRKAEGAAHQTATPVGVFVVHDGEVTWKSADDGTRIALFGELIGLVSAVLMLVVFLRRPPWPDLSARVMTVIGKPHR